MVLMRLGWWCGLIGSASNNSIGDLGVATGDGDLGFVGATDGFESARICATTWSDSMEVTESTGCSTPEVGFKGFLEMGSYPL
ncbi:unnamed protein product [Prunus armeniaca]|uniref:Secreted protein n=1 Tax=Prunus armeniaca TaxID=36596 RepID=A0A6J5WGJ2_PRUAR|nr:hypothetical protein GBA52_008128 [Prunus armeniaca]CAB4299443.1 unnamed protein product [Prunus armeniaca]